MMLDFREIDQELLGVNLALSGQAQRFPYSSHLIGNRLSPPLVDSVRGMIPFVTVPFATIIFLKYGV